MEWYRDVQFIAAVPMPVEWAKEFGTTVNGMWDDPARWNRSAVEQAHREGRRVLVSVPLIALTSRYYERDDERYLLDEACRDILGNPAEVKWYYWDPKPVYSMCIYSRTFRDYLLEKCRTAAAAGVDVVNLDEINTSIGLMSRGPKGSGFCPRCLERYCQYLEGDAAARGRAGVGSASDFRKHDYSLLLQHLREDEALYQEYVSYHERAAFKTIQDFIGELRSVAGNGPDAMAITANLAGLGAFLEGQNRLWGAQWSELIDFVLMENIYLADSREFHGEPRHLLLPRGKFLATYRLASSFASRAPAWVTPQIYVPKQLAGRRSLNYYLLMFLEAYANNGRWGYYWWPGVDAEARRAATAPEALKDYTRFIRDHRGYYERCTTANELVVIYANSAVLANPKGHLKYLALAQALAEAGYQYDVLYSGDDIFTPSRLDAETLDRYRAVLVPEAGNLSADQREALRAYAQRGGRVIFYSANAVGPSSRIATFTDDRLMDFWREYKDHQRLSIVAPLEDLGSARVLTSDPNVSVVVYRKQSALICHVLNYDYREGDDTDRAEAGHRDQPAVVRARGAAHRSLVVLAGGGGGRRPREGRPSEIHHPLS